MNRFKAYWRVVTFLFLVGAGTGLAAWLAGPPGASLSAVASAIVAMWATGEGADIERQEASGEVGGKA